jgi:signal transduction histidine kinase/sugar phosphate isomerase/epimerase
MKIGVQTVLWGHHLDDIPGALDLIASYGCEGVEFTQRIEHLGGIRELHRMLEERGLTFVGLSGGTLQERMDYCGDAARPNYLYVGDWDDLIAPDAVRRGFTLALHPHLFKRIHRLADALNELQKHPDLSFLPDVAHLTIAGDRPHDAIMLGRDRLAAVHIKDWTPEYGRSSHRYARGFVELGSGIINWEQIFSALRRIEYDGWLILEQGTPGADPNLVIQSGVKWLGRIGRVPELRNRMSQSRPFVSRRPTSTLRDRQKPYSVADNNFLASVMLAASESTERCYTALAEAVYKLVDFRLILMCTCSPADNLIVVCAVFPTDVRLDSYVTSFDGSLSSVALERQAITRFDLTLAEPAAKYGRPNARLGYPDLVVNHGLTNLISLPVLNPFNPHHARMVVNLFGQTSATEIEDHYLVAIGECLAMAADSALDERCSLAAASVSVRAGQCLQLNAFLEELKGVTLRALRCEALSILLVNEAGDRLEIASTTGVRWFVPPGERFYRKGEGLTGTLWKNREHLLSVDAREPERIAKSTETVKTTRTSYLCTPMINAGGYVVGMIRCENKSGDQQGAFHMFSEDDLAVIEAISQAAVPHIEVLQSKERRARGLRRITHELHTPIVAIQGATRFMKRELSRQRGFSEEAFSEDYIGDIESWTHLMRRLLGNANFLRPDSDGVSLRLERVHLYGDLFVPALRHVILLLRDREFTDSGIHVERFENIPRLWVDKNLFQQVVFNLIANAIKFAHANPRQFRVHVTGDAVTAGYEIRFRDWGPGIRREIAETIFDEGVRGEEAKEKNVVGDGLGLWVVRRVVEAHGGNIRVTGCSNPTELTIFLPKTLETQKGNL